MHKMFNKCIFVTILLVCCARWSRAEPPAARYDNYRLYEATPVDENQMKILSELSETSDSYIFLNGAQRTHVPLGIIVAPHKLFEFTTLMDSQNISLELVQTNVQQHIDQEHSTNLRRNEVFDWTSYHTLDAINNWLDGLVTDHPDHVSPITIGTTYEGRRIRGVKVSKRTGNPGIFIEGGIHAREWISPAVTTYIINELLTSNVTAVQELSNNYDWYIVPSINADGYVHTHERNRLWRKTRTPHGQFCYGADPNRNWDFHWGEHGTSTYPCAETYGGPKPFSESETKSYAEYLKGLSGRLHTFVSFHSYSQLILLPYGHKPDGGHNHRDLMHIGTKAADALAQRYGTKYTVGPVYETIYPASGSSGDYVFDVLKVPLTFTYELRPKSYRAGFELPADQIIPTGEETLDSLVALLRAADDLGYNKRLDVEE